MKKLDKTSIIMISIFCLLVVGAIIGIVMVSLKPEEQENDVQKMADEAAEEGGMLTVDDILKAIPNAEPGSTYTYYDSDGEMQTITIPKDYNETEYTADNSEKYKFTDFMELSDKFLEICKAGDIDELYKIYYGDFLDQGRLSKNPTPTKAEFDRAIRENMLSVTGFDEYEYGSPDLPPVQSPGAYAAQIYYNVYRKQIPLDTSIIENCVNLVVYIDNAYQTHHFMIMVDGYWYFII